MSSAKLQDTRSMCKNQFYFYKVATNNPKRNQENNFIYHSTEKNKYSRINLTEGSGTCALVTPPPASRLPPSTGPQEAGAASRHCMLEKSRLWLVRLLESWPHWENESHAWSRCKRRRQRRHRGSEWCRRPAGGLEQHSTYPDTAAGGGLCLLHPYYLQLHLERGRDREEKRQNSGLNADGERASQPFLRFFFKKQTNKTRKQSGQKEHRTLVHVR